MSQKERHVATALFILTLLLMPIAAQQKTITGKVVGVSDGDTITVLDGSKRQHKVRLEGIDAPESAQAFGQKSKQSLSDLVFGRIVTVTSSKTDRYGRTLGKVHLEGKNINYVQVMYGMAWCYRDYAKDLSRDDAAAYEQAEGAAKADKRGLWADPSPVAPWEFRRGKRMETVVITAPAATSGEVIGNKNSRIYHRPNCPDYRKVAERNRVIFGTPAEAEKAGYRVAGNCPRQK
jgi:endonuclease YncB( thermonuclease family)